MLLLPVVGIGSTPHPPAHREKKEKVTVKLGNNWPSKLYFNPVSIKSVPNDKTKRRVIVTLLSRNK
jgi:hypothetical protein